MEKKRIPGDGVVTGHGRVDGRPVFVFAQDFTVFGGSLSETYAEKICKVMDLAMKVGAPVIGLNDSGGARIQEGVVSLGGYADIFLRNTLASGVVPQISAIMGPCAGGAVYSPAITDFMVMVKDTSYMFITGPDVIKAVTHEEVTKEELGGAMTHNSTSGVAHFAAADDRDALMLIRELLSYLPSNNMEDPPRRADRRPRRTGPRSCSTRWCRTTPTSPTTSRRSIDRDRRRGPLPRGPRALRQEHRRRLRPAGRAAGGHRGQPARRAGRRAGHRRLGQGRALRPLLRLLQHPAHHLRGRARLPAGTEQEYGGIIRHGAKLLYAYAEATVPKLTVITRKAYGGAYCVMASKHIRADFNFAWPTAEIAVMGPEGAVKILYRRELQKAGDEAEELRTEKVDELPREVRQPVRRGRAGLRRRGHRAGAHAAKLIAGLRLLENKRDSNPPRKHGNIPL